MLPENLARLGSDLAPRVSQAPASRREAPAAEIDAVVRAAAKP